MILSGKSIVSLSRCHYCCVTSSKSRGNIQNSPSQRPQITVRIIHVKHDYYAPALLVRSEAHHFEVEQMSSKFSGETTKNTYCRKHCLVLQEPHLCRKQPHAIRLWCLLWCLLCWPASGLHKITVTFDVTALPRAPKKLVEYFARS